MSPLIGICKIVAPLLRCFMIWRGPDFTIGPATDLYLRRWYVIPKNRWFNIYLHHFLRSDDDRALHDHSYRNVSCLLTGSYVEVTQAGRVTRRPFRLIPRRADALHRVELIAGQPVWSLFFTGPRVREWGFACPNGWRHHEEFISAYPGGNETGRGCE